MKPKNIFRVAPCENCEGSDFNLIFTGGDKLLGIPGEFQIVQCNQCGIYLLAPKISTEEMENYYPEEYICYLEAIEDDNSSFQRLNRKKALDKRCNQVTKRIKKPGKILDVGCATGIFLDGMQKRGWAVKGVEPNKKAAQYAEKRFGLDVFNGYLHDANLPDGTFDVVTLWDVLEHVPNPDNFIEEVFRLLKPGGIVIGTLPNADAWERHLFGEHWVGWEIPRHYRAHTPETITSFLERLSFKEIELFSFIGRHGAFMLSVTFWLNSWEAAKWKKMIINKSLGSLPVRIITHPFFLLAEMLNRSNVMSFSAKKPENASNKP